MPRKPVNKSRAVPSAGIAAIGRLASLAGAATPPARMVREVEKIIAEWRAEPDLDQDVLRERMETLRDDLAAGLASAEEQASDVDRSDAAAVRQATASVAGLKAVRDAVASEL